MNNDDVHARRTCRVLVLSILGIVVITFLLVLWFIHGPTVEKKHARRHDDAAQQLLSVRQRKENAHVLV